MRCQTRHAPRLDCSSSSSRGPQDRLDAVGADILAWHASSEASQRLADRDRDRPFGATALEQRSVTRASAIRPVLRGLAGLDPTPLRQPRQGKLGKITKAGDRYLRTLLIHGARALVGTLRRRWHCRALAAQTVGRRPVNVAATAAGAQDCPGGGRCDPPEAMAGTSPATAAA